MPHPSPSRLLILHGLRLKGFAEPDAVAALWALDEGEVAAELHRLAGDGFVQRRDGRVSGWSLTAEGRTVHAKLVAADLDESGARDTVERGYRRFLEVNPMLLGVCTAWQLRPDDGGQIINDHSDVAYDSGVIDELARVHADTEPVFADLAAVLDRFGPYGPRLQHALERVRAGATEWFTRPLVDSYHTVWFELHEDLLSTLGLQRGDEARA